VEDALMRVPSDWVPAAHGKPLRNVIKVAY
jgi:hypothetical protein